MADQDAFALLAGGLKFDRRRFAKDIQAFQPNGKHSGAGTAAPGTKHSAVAQKAHAKAGKGGQGIQLYSSRQTTQSAGSEDEEEEAEEQHCDMDVNDETATNAERADSNKHASTSAPGAGDGLVDPRCPVLNTRDPLEAANVVRKHYRIKVSGSDIPAPLRSWAELGPRWGATGGTLISSITNILAASSTATKESQAGGAKQVAGAGAATAAATTPKGKAAHKAVAKLLEALRQENLDQPTPIQRQAVPSLLAGRELLGVAPTGSGKTLAFMVPIILQLQALRSSGDWPAAPKAVILSPTHELAAQQARVLKLLLPGTGLRASLLTKSTAAGTDFSKVDILLANPLRLATMVLGEAQQQQQEQGEGAKAKESKDVDDVSSQGEDEDEDDQEEKSGGDGKDPAPPRRIDLSQARFLVLDEADKLFEMGFVEQIDGVVAACSHPHIVRALFSATLPDKVEELARTVLQQPLRVTIGAKNTAVSSVSQRLLFVGRENGKLLALRQLLTEGLKPPVLVFVASKERAKALHRELLYDGVHVDSITASSSQAARAAAVDNFRSGRTWVLIATDLIGRGMDFLGVQTVINYDFPFSATDYIHRIGRTGRAYRTGTAITFYTEEDAPSLRPIANLIREAGGEVPEWMSTGLKKVRTRDRKRAKLPPAVRSGDTISTEPVRKRHSPGKSQPQTTSKGQAGGKGSSGGEPSRKRPRPHEGGGKPGTDGPGAAAKKAAGKAAGDASRQQKKKARQT